MNEYIQLGVGLAIVAGGLISNTKLIGYHIGRALKPIDDTVDGIAKTQKIHGVMLEEHNKHLSRYSTNEAFYKSIEETIEEALRYLEDDHKASQYIDSVGRDIIDFSKEILLAGINDVTDKTVQTKAKRYVDASKELNKNLFGKVFSIKYYQKHSPITRKYIKDVCQISEDNVNDKTKRFRSITMVYIETICSNFVNFYLSNRDLKDKINNVYAKTF